MDWTPLGALIVSVILLPMTAALWYTKADRETVDEAVKKKADEKTVSEAINAVKTDNGHLREWLTQHTEDDKDMFHELRQGQKALSDQIQQNFQTLIMEIRRAGNGNGGSNGKH